MAKRKTVRQEAPKQEVRKGFSMNTRAREDEIRERIMKFSGVIRTLTTTLKTEQPPHDPFELIAYENTWHSRCMRAKVNALVGQGYQASPALRQHIDRPNGKYSLEVLLRKTSRDYVEHGTMYTENIRGRDTASIFHSPTIKTRICFDREKQIKTFMKFNFEWSRAFLGYLELPEFEDGVTHGIKQLTTCESKQGNEFYGDPTWIDSKPLLRMNWNIIKSANRFFDHSLMSDLAIIEKGMGRTDEDIDSIKDYIGNHMAGADNAHKILYLNVAPDEDIKFEKLQSDFQGRETTEVRKANREEIIANHDLFPRLVAVIEAGAWGGGDDLEAQLKAFKYFYADAEQRILEAWWQDLFEELGFPDFKSFKLNPIYITSSDSDMKTLATGVQAGILTPEQATQEWMFEKKAGGLIKTLNYLKNQLD